MHRKCFCDLPQPVQLEQARRPREQLEAGQAYREQEGSAQEIGLRKINEALSPAMQDSS